MFIHILIYYLDALMKCSIGLNPTSDSFVRESNECFQSNFPLLLAKAGQVRKGSSTVSFSFPSHQLLQYSCKNTPNQEECLPNNQLPVAQATTFEMLSLERLRNSPELFLSVCVQISSVVIQVLTLLTHSMNYCFLENIIFYL